MSIVPGPVGSPGIGIVRHPDVRIGGKGWVAHKEKTSARDPAYMYVPDEMAR